jgi:hypothetical protein
MLPFIGASGLPIPEKYPESKGHEVKQTVGSSQSDLLFRSRR